MEISLVTNFQRRSLAFTIAFVFLHVFLLVVGIHLCDLYETLSPLEQTSGGLLQPVLLANWILFVVLIGGVLFTVGRIKPSTLGLTSKGILAGLLFSFLLWASIEIVNLIWGMAAQGHANPISLPNDKPIGFLVGKIIGQFFGNALFEEVAYRAFLLPQIYLMVKDRFPPNSIKSVAVALLLSQIVFALIHIPYLIYLESSLAYLVIPLAGGVLFSLAWLRTKNLFVAIGVHALSNPPFPVFSVFAEGPTILIFGAVALLFVSLWPKRFNW